MKVANLQALASKLLGAAKTTWSAADSYNAAMPSAEIEYKIVPASMLYATYSRGFLAGIPAGGILNGVTMESVLPEHVNAYEVGWKSALFEDHLRLNLDVFRENYTDLQVSSSSFNARSDG